MLNGITAYRVLHALEDDRAQGYSLIHIPSERKQHPGQQGKQPLCNGSDLAPWFDLTTDRTNVELGIKTLPADECLLPSYKTEKSYWASLCKVKTIVQALSLLTLRLPKSSNCIQGSCRAPGDGALLFLTSVNA